MYYNIFISKEDIEKLQNINTLYESSEDFKIFETINVNCVFYIHFYKLFDYTSLSKDVINIICEYTNEQIELAIMAYNNKEHKYIRICATHTISEGIRFHFDHNGVKNKVLYYVSDKILKHDSVISDVFTRGHVHIRNS